MERLKKIRDDDYEQMFIGRPEHNGDFKWFPVIKLEYTDEWGDANEQKDTPYYVSLRVVSPEAAGQKGLDDAFSCCGIENMDDDVLKQEIVQVEMLSEYGTFAQVFSKMGKNKRDLLNQASKELEMLRIFFGFYMDRQVNMIGNTGWDFVKGEIGFK